MTRNGLFMTACAAIGAAVLLGSTTGCDESRPQNSLLVNPEAARLTDKMPTTLDELDPVEGDTVVPGDDEEQFEGVCIDPAVDPVAVGDDGVPVEPAPCETMEFHQKWPPWKYSTKVTGKHLKSADEYSNYDIGGGKIIRHIKSGPLKSLYYRFGF